MNHRYSKAVISKTGIALQQSLAYKHRQDRRFNITDLYDPECWPLHDEVVSEIAEALEKLRTEERAK